VPEAGQVAAPARELRDRLKRLAIPSDCIVAFPVRKNDAAIDRTAADWFPDPLASALVGRPRPTGLRVGIFGTGAGAMKVWEALADIDTGDAVWFADNNAAQQGKTFLWLDVIAPSAIAANRYDVIVIGSMSLDPIRRQLLNLGVRGRQILTPNVSATVPAIREELALALGALEEVLK